MNTRRTRITVIIVLSFVAILSTLLYFCAPQLNSIYGSKLQTPLFTGFLTLGSFLLTLKTFIVVQIKEKLYDSPQYIERIATLRFQDSSLSLYDPIIRLAELLLIAVIMALGTAFLQITVGFIERQLTTVICFSFAIGTLLLIAFAWWQIRKNIYDLFEFWSEVKEKEIQDKQAELQPKVKA